jgi:hypothetical protein
MERSLGYNVLMKRVAVMSIAVALLVALGTAQKLEQPGPGTKLRKAVLDGLRPSIEKDLKQKVIFVVSKIRVYDGWAFVQCRPVTPKSKPIDFKKTKYKEMIDQGMFDGDTTYALLRLKNGKWAVKDFVIGPTDVYWLAWTDPPFSAPKQVLPLP